MHGCAVILLLVTSPYLMKPATHLPMELGCPMPAHGRQSGHGLASRFAADVDVTMANLPRRVVRAAERLGNHIAVVLAPEYEGGRLRDDLKHTGDRL